MPLVQLVLRVQLVRMAPPVQRELRVRPQLFLDLQVQRELQEPLVPVEQVQSDRLAQLEPLDLQAQLEPLDLQVQLDQLDQAQLVLLDQQVRLEQLGQVVLAVLSTQTSHRLLLEHWTMSSRDRH